MNVAKMNLTVICEEGLHQNHFLTGGECVQKLHLAMDLMQGSFQLLVVVLVVVEVKVLAVVMMVVAVVVVMGDGYVVEELAEEREGKEEDASSSCCNQSDNLGALHGECYAVQGNVLMVKVALQVAVAYHGGDGGDGYGGLVK